MQANTLADNGIGALSFGIKLPDGRLAYPTAPTWIAYGGDDSHCYDNIPVLIRRSTFCDVFVAEARLFLRYSSWLLALLLSQVGIPSYAKVTMTCGCCKNIVMRCVLWLGSSSGTSTIVSAT